MTLPILGLTLTQPWATLKAVGEKRYETRGWSTKFRGLLAIHAAKNFPEWAKDVARTEPFLSVLSAHGFLSPVAHLNDVLGKIVCVVELVDVVKVHDAVPTVFGEQTVRTMGGDRIYPLAPPAPHEASFGNYAAGRFAWITRNLRRLATPVPARGKQSTWVLLPETERAVRAQIEPT